MQQEMHDLGGADGYGPVRYSADEPPFHADWERRVFGLLGAVTTASAQRPGEFRYALERLHPDDYFGHGYFGRWLAGFELLLAEYGVVSTEEMAAKVRSHPENQGVNHLPPSAHRATPTIRKDLSLLPPDVEVPQPSHRGVRRELAVAPLFAVGDQVVAPAAVQAGHTRLPAYAADKPGTVVRVHPAEVLPDSAAHDHGERPQHVYCVGYDAATLWGDGADPKAIIHVDLYECYLEAAPAHSADAAIDTDRD